MKLYIINLLVRSRQSLNKLNLPHPDRIEDQIQDIVCQSTERHTKFLSWSIDDLDVLLRNETSELCGQIVNVVHDRLNRQICSSLLEYRVELRQYEHQVAINSSYVREVCNIRRIARVLFQNAEKLQCISGGSLLGGNLQSNPASSSR